MIILKWVYFLKNKSKYFQKFKQSKVRVQKNLGKSILCLKYDNGGKYYPKVFDKFCMREGIKHKNTSPYTPQQNGVAERMNHTIMEHARNMMKTFGLDNGIQVDDLNKIAYIINRSPTIALDEQIQ